MAVIKVRDLASGRLQAPDLDLEEELLTAFGMVRAARTPTALYMRGTDAGTTSTSPSWVIPDCSASHGRSQRGGSQGDREFPGASGIEASTNPAAANGCGSKNPTAIDRSGTGCASSRSRSA